MSDLTPAQYDRMMIITSNTGMDSIFKVNINDISTIDSNIILVDVLNSMCGDVYFKGKNVKFKSNQDFEWYGELLQNDVDSCCRMGYLFLKGKGDKKFGEIQIEEEHYSIDDIGGGYRVIVQEPGNSNSFCEGAVVPEGSNLKGQDSHGNNIDNEISYRESGNCTVKVLGLYTHSAKINSFDIEQIIERSVSHTNNALLNSGIPEYKLNLELVGTEEFGLDETKKTFLNVLNEVQGSSIAHSMRDNYDADIVVLFVNDAIMDDDDAVGKAFLGPSNSFAYAVVNNIDGSRIFSHEFGHLLDADHEPCDAYEAGNNCIDINISGDNRAHSWHYTSYHFPCSFPEYKRKTIMFSVNSSDKIQYYSNPEVNFEDYPTGIPNQRNNAAMLKANGCTVANFRSGTDHLYAYIDGDDKVNWLHSAHFTAIYNGAPGPYTFEWKVNKTGMNWDNTPVYSTNSYITVNTFPEYNIGDVIFTHLLVTASNGETSESEHYTIVVDGGGQSIKTGNNNVVYEQKNMIAYPNPANSFVKLTYFIEDNSSVKIKILNSQGKLLRVLYKKDQKAGYHTEKLDFSNFSNALYIVELTGNNKTQRIPVILNK